MLEFQQDPDYIHQLDDDTGRVDSICRYCFQTVATARKPDVLRIAELQHDCPGKQQAKRESA